MGKESDRLELENVGNRADGDKWLMIHFQRDQSA
jgi:hypothetical protein